MFAAGLISVNMDFRMSPYVTAVEKQARTVEIEVDGARQVEVWGLEDRACDGLARRPETHHHHGDAGCALRQGPSGPTAGSKIASFLGRLYATVEKRFKTKRVYGAAPTVPTRRVM